jgi:hypothetical protein
VPHTKFRRTGRESLGRAGAVTSMEMHRRVDAPFVVLSEILSDSEEASCLARGTIAFFGLRGKVERSGARHSPVRRRSSNVDTFVDRRLVVLFGRRKPVTHHVANDPPEHCRPGGGSSTRGRAAGARASTARQRRRNRRAPPRPRGRCSSGRERGAAGPARAGEGQGEAEVQIRTSHGEAEGAEE